MDYNAYMKTCRSKPRHVGHRIYATMAILDPVMYF